MELHELLQLDDKSEEFLNLPLVEQVRYYQWRLEDANNQIRQMIKESNNETQTQDTD